MVRAEETNRNWKKRAEARAMQVNMPVPSTQKPEENEYWQIKYFMDIRGRVILKEEVWRTEKGYHEKLKKFWDENQFSREGKSPIYKIRDENYVELLNAHGKHLPIIPMPGLEGAVLLHDSEHPIKMRAPDGAEYSYPKK